MMKTALRRLKEKKDRLNAAIFAKEQERLQAAWGKAQKERNPTRKEGPCKSEDDPIQRMWREKNEPASKAEAFNASEQGPGEQQQEQAEANRSRQAQERIKGNQRAKNDWQHELILKAKKKKN